MFTYFIGEFLSWCSFKNLDKINTTQGSGVDVKKRYLIRKGGCCRIPTGSRFCAHGRIVTPTALSSYESLGLLVYSRKRRSGRDRIFAFVGQPARLESSDPSNQAVTFTVCVTPCLWPVHSPPRLHTFFTEICLPLELARIEMTLELDIYSNRPKNRLISLRKSHRNRKEQFLMLRQKMFARSPGVFGSTLFYLIDIIS